MNVHVQFVASAGGALLPGTTLLLSYAVIDGAERVVTQLCSTDGQVLLDKLTATECLVRVRVFAPPADLVFDRCYPPSYTWPATMTIAVREPAPSRALRKGAMPSVHLASAPARCSDY